MRTIGVVTVARSDYGIYLPILRRIQEDPNLHLHLMVTGMHLSPEFGMTIKTIQEDGFKIGDQVEMLVSSDTPEGISKSMGLGAIGFAQAYSRTRPDILLVLGDRFEMHTAVVSSLPFNIPVAHIHGGESTEGAFDEALRHSITKMSHLHFVSTDTYARRVIQMGEEPWRVLISGAPGLDILSSITWLDQKELEQQYSLDLSSPFLMATYHPVTLEYQDTRAQVTELLDALEEVEYSTIFTYPNADTGSRVILQMLREYVERHPRAQLIGNFGTQGYWSILKYSIAMVGNSSSGIIEAASLKLPVVNIGDRQKGRVRGKNVIDVGCTREEIRAGIGEASSHEFLDSLQNMKNPYGDGHASQLIVERLKDVELDNLLLQKHFHDN